MASSNRKSRLSPPLMYVFRLAHDAKDARNAEAWREERAGGSGARSRIRQRVPITERILRAEVSHDLESLMNCISLDSTVDLEAFPRVRKSILNFGFPDIANRTVDELQGADLDREIETVIRLYEPRLVADTVRVARDQGIDSMTELKIRYVVNGDLSCEPLNVPVEFVAQVEVTTGKIQIARL